MPNGQTPHPAPLQQTPANQGLSTEAPRYSYIEHAYTRRSMKIYSVYESEIQNMAIWNTLVIICCAIGSFFLGIPITILANFAFAEKLTPAGEVASHLVAPLLFIVAVAFYVAAGVIFWKKGSIWDEIREESQPIAPMMLPTPDTQDSSRPTS